MSWPPTLTDLKADLSIPDDNDDVVLTQSLDAAIAFVIRTRSDIDFGQYPLPGSKTPDVDLELGTLRLAGRWFTRRRSPEALIDAGELGSARVPSFDPDIDRLLRIGRFRRSVIA